MIIPVLVTIYSDRTFTFITQDPAGLGSAQCAPRALSRVRAEPNRNKVGKVTKKQVEDIAKIKLVDLIPRNLDSAVRTVMGTARNMGLEVVEA